MIRIISFFIFIWAVNGAICCLIYIWCFRKVKRPHYRFVAGEYCLEKARLIREEFFYRAGASTLKGYFYPNSKSDKLMVIVHGYRSGADDFLPLIKEFLQNGYNVFSYDSTGTYDSKGASLIGACQFLVDLDNTLNYIENNEKFNKFSLYLTGHSLGGYAVLSILSLHKNVKGCLAYAPVNNGALLMEKTARAYLGIVVSIHKPFLDIIQKCIFGKYVNFTGVKGINSIDIPIMVVQGVNDKIVGRKNISVNSYKKEIKNKKVVFISVTGENGGHSEIWHSIRAVKYKREVDEKMKKLSKKKRAEYYKKIDHKRYSEANVEIVKQFVNALEN